MSSAGFELVSGRIPGERIATTVTTSASSAFTAETSLGTVTAALVNGRTYRIRWAGSMDSTVNNDEAMARIRLTNTSGTILQGQRFRVDATTGSACTIFAIEVEYTATATGNQTFVATGERTSGTGDLNLAAGATFPTYLYVDYIRG